MDICRVCVTKLLQQNSANAGEAKSHWHKIEETSCSTWLKYEYGIPRFVSITDIQIV